MVDELIKPILEFNAVRVHDRPRDRRRVGFGEGS